jgi:hypothetical protein
MPSQPQLFGDPQVRWRLGRRSVHVVPRRDLTGYTIRVRWSEKLGLQLDHVFVDLRRAQDVVQRIYTSGFLTLACWKRIYRPKWSPTCRTLTR